MSRGIASEESTGLGEALAALDGGEADVRVAASLSRLGRPPSERLRVAGRHALALRKSGATWRTVAVTLSAGRPARGSSPTVPDGHSTRSATHARQAADTVTLDREAAAAVPITAPHS